MKEEKIKEYEAHLVKLKDLSKELGVDCAYIDSRGVLVLSSDKPTKFEGLITMNMYRQDVFAKAIINAVIFYFSHQEEMKDAVTKLREEDALNEAKSAVDKLLKKNGFN